MNIRPALWSILSTVLLISGFASTATGAEIYQRFDGHKVYRAVATTQEQLALLKSVEDATENGILFWKSPGSLNIGVDVMVSPKREEELLSTFDTAGISYERYIDDVQTLIDRENPEIARGSELRANETSTLNWTAYHRLDAIYSWLDELANNYPNWVEPITYGTSYEGRALKGIKISFGEDNPGILVEGGIHAREWITPATVTYLINEILEPTNVVFSLLARSHTWFVFPVANPDGYEYTHTTSRMWRKTRAPYANGCYGADPNRNWDYYWMANGGATNNSCSETYAGPEPFSELEARALADFMASVREEFYIYLSIHSYSQLILLPYGYTYDHLDNYNDAMRVGTKAAEALAKRYGTRYTVGATAETIYIASGVSTDYVKGVLGTPIVYCYELRDQGTYGFLLPAEQIIPTALEFIDSLVAVIGESRTLGYPPSHVNQLDDV